MKRLKWKLRTERGLSRRRREKKENSRKKGGNVCGGVFHEDLKLPRLEVKKVNEKLRQVAEFVKPSLKPLF